MLIAFQHQTSCVIMHKWWRAFMKLKKSKKLFLNLPFWIVINSKPSTTQAVFLYGYYVCTYLIHRSYDNAKDENIWRKRKSSAVVFSWSIDYYTIKSTFHEYLILFLDQFCKANVLLWTLWGSGGMLMESWVEKDVRILHN